MLFEDYPIRFWDIGSPPGASASSPRSCRADPEARLEPADLTGDPGPVFLESDFDISPDGRTIVTQLGRLVEPAGDPDLSRRHRRRDEGPPNARRRRLLLRPAEGLAGRPLRRLRSNQHRCARRASASTVWLVDLSTGEGRDLTPKLDLWPENPAWAPDSSAVFFVADVRAGSRLSAPIWWTAGPRALSRGAISDLCPSPDGQTIYALRATMTAPPRIVRFAASGEKQTPVELSHSIDDGGLGGRGRVERLSATAADGTAIGSWLVLPPDTSAEQPAPLVVFAHGGPHRVVERLALALEPASPRRARVRGAAAGPGHLDRLRPADGRARLGRWGETPYTDLMALDAALTRPDLDASRTALTGGSYGGYMANWVAGHTDRFRAIVTHASLWDLRPFHGTTDTGADWEHEMGDPYRQPELYDGTSPAAHIGSIRTPMLVIHGERDFRVPVSEALALWTDLRRHGVSARFLYFPDENHWVLKPNNARLWYETILAFLDEHVLGKEWVRPALL